MKVCSRCKDEKEDKEFRTRTEKRPCKLKGKPPFEYLESKCIDCERLHRNEIAVKSKGKNREKNARKAREYHAKNRDACLVRMKNRRDRPENKDYRKNYYRKNRHRILEQHRNVCKRAQIELRDWYVVCKLAQKKHKGIREEVKKDKELIEVKRLQITLKRLTNERANRSTGKENAE